MTDYSRHLGDLRLRANVLLDEVRHERDIIARYPEQIRVNLETAYKLREMLERAKNDLPVREVRLKRLVDEIRRLEAMARF